MAPCTGLRQRTKIRHEQAPRCDEQSTCVLTSGFAVARLPGHRSRCLARRTLADAGGAQQVRCSWPGRLAQLRESRQLAVRRLLPLGQVELLHVRMAGHKTRAGVWCRGLGYTRPPVAR